MDQAELMLREIRKTLSQAHDPRHQQLQTLPNDEVEKFLAESYQLVQEDQLRQNDPHLIYSKVSEASMLLSQQSSMIKNYVKSKIQSQCFGARQYSKQQKKIVVGRKRQLQKKRLEEKVEQSKKINSMIEEVRKLNHGQNQSNIPLDKMQSILHEEGVNIDNFVKQDYKVRSSNNNVRESSKFQFDVFGQKIQTNKSKIKQDDDEFKIQVHGIQEDYEGYAQKKNKSMKDRINQILTKNHKFLQVFAGFLNQQMTKNQAISVVIPTDDVLDNVKKVKKRFTFENQFANSWVSQPNIGPSVGQLSQLYSFKPFIEQKQIKYEQKVEKKEVKKLVNKRNGDSNKFHMKTTILEGNKLYYSDQQNDGVKMSEMKFIQIQLNPLEFINLTKEEGSVFQKKENQIQAVILRGINRTFTYQLNFAQGIQLTQELNKIYLRRFHKINTLVGYKNNKDMGRFIEEEHSTLNLSQNYIKLEQEYPKKIGKQKSNFITMLCKLFPLRKSTHILNFKKCGLSLNDLNLIIKQCEAHFTHIQHLDFSETKLDSKTLKNILNLVKKCPPSKTVTLILSNCGIDDNVIQSNIPDLSNLCSKIGDLSLLKNQITSQSIKSLKNIFSSKVCEIKTLNLSGNPIKDFSQFAGLVKLSNKIEKILANECSITINSQKLVEDLLVSTKQRQELKKVELKRNICTGSISWFEQISPYLEISIDLPIKSSSSRTLESKFLRVISTTN